MTNQAHSHLTRSECMGQFLLLEKVGNPLLMSDGLMQTLCDHSLGNFRIMTTLANELLEEACKQKRTQLDEKLYFEVFHLSAKTSVPTHQERKYYAFVY